MAGMKSLLAIALPAALGACATALPPGMQARSACSDLQGGWCGFVSQMALSSYEYGPLAQNAYAPDHETFTQLPAGISLREFAPNDSSGFAYAIFERHEGEALREVILAFRGTEFSSLDDWLRGNFGSGQRERGMALFTAERARLDEAGQGDVLVSVTGHSLGGAIAAHIAQADERVKLRAFNTSPNFMPAADALSGDRILISETGEALERLRSGSAFPGQDIYMLDCQQGESTFYQHKMRPLADCLIWIAAYREQAAHDLVATNGVKAPAQNRYCNESGEALAHPGPAGYGDARLHLCAKDGGEDQSK